MVYLANLLITTTVVLTQIQNSYSPSCNSSKNRLLGTFLQCSPLAGDQMVAGELTIWQLGGTGQVGVYE